MVAGRLAVVAGDRPHIFPVNFVVDRGGIVFRTAAGLKLAAARQRWVAFEADGVDADQRSVWSVVVTGKAEPVDEKSDLISAARLPLVPYQSGKKPWLLRIAAESVSGRRIRLPDNALATEGT